MESTGGPEPPTGIRRALFRLPVHLYRLRLGALLGRRFVLINHVGRTTGLPRQAVVEVVTRDPATGAVTVAAGFGAGSDWYQNLLAHPDVTIQIGSRTIPVRAAQLAEDQAAEAMVGYARRHPRAARALARVLGFGVDGTESDYRTVGRRLPMVRFDPV